MKRIIQTSLLLAFIGSATSAWSFTGAGAFADGLSRGMQQGMQLRLQQQQLEMMERAEKREQGPSARNLLLDRFIFYS